MINFNLAGPALVHCLKVSGARLMLVDDDEKFQERIRGSSPQIENELGIKAVVLSQALKAEIGGRAVERPDDSYRAGVTGPFPAALFYTRCVVRILPMSAKETSL